jgi:hypothetical protein
MTIEHEQCGRCGRDLKSAKSKVDGYGSKCKKKMLEEKNAATIPIDEDDLIFFE